MGNQLSGERPSVLESLNAISGDILLSAFTKQLNVDGDTNNFSATVRELILYGVKYTSLINPMDEMDYAYSLVIALIINNVNI